MTNYSLIEKLKFEVHHAAQDSEFDTGFNLAKEMAIEVVRHYCPSEISDVGEFYTQEERGRQYLIYDSEDEAKRQSQCVPPVFADEFKRLLKFEREHKPVSGDYDENEFLHED